MRSPIPPVRATLGLLALAAFAGCFGDTQQPAAYRFACKADGDCSDPERCIDGLCQVPCTFATAQDDCPSEKGFATCFNGACANLCELSDEGACPGDQVCVSVPFDGGGSGGGGGIDTSMLGVCGIECSSGSCPDGELCLEGICVPTGGDTTGDTGGTN